MSLRKKTVLVFVLTFVILVGTLNLFAHIYITRTYREHEKREMEVNVARARAAIQREVETLDTILRDWAYWDDTYAFVADPSSQYIETNLTEKTFVEIGVHTIVYLNTAGEIVFQKAVDLPSNSETSVPAGLLTHLVGDCPLKEVVESGEGKAAIILLPEGPFIMASEPVLTSEGAGPPRGAMIMARRLDDQELGRIAASVQLYLHVAPLDLESTDSSWQKAAESLLSGSETFVQPLSSSIIQGYTLLRDIYGEPALILRVETGREIYRQGLNSLFYFMAMLSFSCLAIYAVTYLLLEKSALSRMSRLGNKIANIGATGDPSLRLSVAGTDEVSRLAESINSMMDRLENEERRFRSMIENSLDTVLMLDGEGRVVYQSPSAERVFGYSRDELQGKDIFSLLHPDDRERSRNIFFASLRHPESQGHHEVRFLHGDGDYRYIEFTGTNLLQDPAVNGVVINARDVSERVRSRQRLEKLSRLFVELGTDSFANTEMILFASRDIMEAASASYGRIDGKRFIILSTKPGEGAFKVFDQPDNCPIFELFRRNAQQPVIRRGGDLLDHCGKRTTPTQQGRGLTAAYPVLRGGDTIGYLSIFWQERAEPSPEDIEILGMLARALSVEEERFAREQALKDFIDIASHELRHPITLMKGYALTLREHGEKLSLEARRELLDAIDSGSDRLEALIRDLLDTSRIERGHFQLVREETDLPALLESAITEMERKGYPHRFVLSLSRDSMTRLVDAEKLTRVIIILLDNAVNFSNGLSPVELVLEEKDGEAIVSVMDRGPGIPERDRERVFERFYQVEDARYHSRPGIGLGLYIAREIVEAHGGRIWYEPRSGGGSVFRFSVP